jgi:hypothetical protein
MLLSRWWFVVLHGKRPSPREVARGLEVDLAKFDRALADHRHMQRLEAGERFAVAWLPPMWINNYVLSGYYDLDDVARVIERLQED